MYLYSKWSDNTVQVFLFDSTMFLLPDMITIGLQDFLRVGFDGLKFFYFSFSEGVFLILRILSGGKRGFSCLQLINRWKLFVM